MTLRISLAASAAAVTALLCSTSALAQGYAAPKLPGTQTPDLRGLWQAQSTAYRNIEGHAGGKGVAPSKSIIVDTPDGKIPYKPEALARRAENAADNYAADPHKKCFQAGMPRATLVPEPMQIVQSPEIAAILYQDNHAFRVLNPASVPHAEGIDWWMGDSRAHWEGDTLVVDVTLLNTLAWLDDAGNHQSSDSHIVERYRRTGPDTIAYEARFDDPATYTRPWTIRETLRKVTTQTRLIEDECLEDINDVRHPISPSDPANLLRNNYKRWQIAAKLGLLTTPVDVITPPEGPPPPPPAPVVTGPIPRTVAGKPNFTGLWSTVGIPGGGSGAATLGAAAAGPPPSARPATAGGGAPTAAGGLKAGDDASRAFARAGVPRLPYTMEGLQEQMWRSRHQVLDGEPRCHLAGLPRAHQQPPYPHQIIQDDKSVTILYEYVHEPRVIPLDNSAHPANYRAWSGDSRAHWEGDTLVVDTANFNGRSWLDMNGNFVDENEHVVERFTLLDDKSYAYRATVTNPGVFSAPWTFSLTGRREPATAQLLEYSCLEGEQDRQRYPEDMGGVSAAVTAALEKAPFAWGCLRGDLQGDKVNFSLQRPGGAVSRVNAPAEMTKRLVELIDREVKLLGVSGTTTVTPKAVEVLSEGCAATFK